MTVWSGRDPGSWGILADDLTGATDVAAAFVLAGFPAEVVLDRDAWRASPGSAVVAVLSTDSRHVSPAAARAKVQAACHWMRGRRRLVVYKKLDSTLQGNILVE